MTIDISKWIDREPYTCIPTAIGELCIFGITIGGRTDLLKDIGKPIEKCEPATYVRNLCKYICFPIESLREGKYKLDKPLLSANAIASLTVDNLEAIAKIFVENNEYLTKKRVSRTEQNEKGEIVVHLGYGEIEYPQNEGESFIQYLARLSVKEAEKERKQMEKMFSSISGLGSFSRSLGDSIKDTLLWGDTLKKTMENFRPLHDSVATRNIEPEMEVKRWAEMAQRNEEMRLKPFNDLSDKLDELINASTQATEFLVKANEIQTRIAGEIKSSSDETTAFAQKNVVLSFVVIVLTVLGMCVSLFTVYLSNTDGTKQRQMVQEYVNQISGKLTDINGSIAGQNEPLRTENERLKNNLAKQEREINKMKRQIEREGSSSHK